MGVIINFVIIIKLLLPLFQLRLIVYNRYTINILFSQDLIERVTERTATVAVPSEDISCGKVKNLTALFHINYCQRIKRLTVR